MKIGLQKVIQLQNEKYPGPFWFINSHSKSNLRTSIYCKICLVANMVQDELRNKSTGIIHNELIMQWED